MLKPIHVGETLAVDVVITEGGEPLPLATAIAAAAALDTAGNKVPGTVDSSGAALGVFVMHWTAGLLAEELWTVQFRATHPDSSVEHFVAEQILVKPTAF